MFFTKFTINHLIKLVILLIGFFVVTSCGLYKKTDARKVPVSGMERAQKNIEQGKGFRLLDTRRNRGSGEFKFASSNPMWRASLEILDFIPLTTVDYSGGMIITDWYSDNTANTNESLKITVRFLSNEIRSDSLKIVIHKKECGSNQVCNVNLVSNSVLKEELQSTILRKAILIDKEQRNNKRKKN